MDKKSCALDCPLKHQIQNLCQFVEKKLDDSTRQLCKKLTNYQSDMELFQWLKQVFVALISSKSNLEQLMTSRQETQCGKYEQSLQKLQSDIRHHIAIEAQMKIHYQSLQEKLQMVESERVRLGTQISKLRKKQMKEKQVKDKDRERDVRQKQNERWHNKLFKKKVQEQCPKTTRGRSNTMIGDKSKNRLREQWEMTQNIELNNHHNATKVMKRGKNASKSKILK